MSGLADLPNLGPVTAGRLREVGVETPQALRHLGAVDAYRRLKFAFPRHTNVVCLMALEGALTGVDWRRLDPGRLAALKQEAKR